MHQLIKSKFKKVYIQFDQNKKSIQVSGKDNIQATIELKALLVKLTEIKYPFFWEEKIQMITDENFKVKRYLLDPGGSEYKGVAARFFRSMKSTELHGIERI